jgi:hemoglobin-like flavoprotein
MKVDLVIGSFNRSKGTVFFAQTFYTNLFFLNPKIEKYFEKTDFEHQEKALVAGLGYLFDFLDQSNDNARKQVLRLSRTHSKHGLNIHPHDYYYWIEALIMTMKDLDQDWHKSLEYYCREVLFYPISFMISQYFLKED